MVITVSLTQFTNPSYYINIIRMYILSHARRDPLYYINPAAMAPTCGIPTSLARCHTAGTRSRYWRLGAIVILDLGIQNMVVPTSDNFNRYNLVIKLGVEIGELRVHIGKLVL